MNKKNILYAGLGLWLSGLLVGANVVDFLPGEPSWPSWVILVIGLFVGFASLLRLLRAIRQTE